MVVSFMSLLAPAIEHFGSRKNLADACNVSRMTVSHWEKRGVPLERAFDIERLSAGAVTAKALRPDILDGSQSSQVGEA